MRNQAIILETLLLLGVTASAAGGAQVTGRVRVVGRPGRMPVPTILYAESLNGRAPARPGHYKLVQRNKTFMPRVLAVPVGSTVDFPNEDPIFHNAFSLARPNPFDLGLYRSGASKSRVFSETAIYRVFCNIHPQMTAVILVLPTSHITEADSAGTFRFDLPPGRYRLTAWSERSQPAVAEISVSSGAVAVPDLELDESKFIETPHKNKFGQDYTGSAYDPTRDHRP